MNASTRDGTGQSSAGVFSSAATSVQQSQPAEAQPTKKITSRRQLQAQEATSASARRNVPDRSPCTLFAITQFECTATDRVRCWPIERIFRQCAGSPAMEVTNRLVHSGNNGKDGRPVTPPLVDPAFIAHPPRGNVWDDLGDKN